MWVAPTLQLAFRATIGAKMIATVPRGGCGTAAPAPGGGSGAIIFALGKSDGERAVGLGLFSFQEQTAFSGRCGRGI